MKAFWEAAKQGFMRPFRLDIYDKQFLLGALSGYFATRFGLIDNGAAFMIVDLILMLVMGGWAIHIEYKDRKKNGTLGEF